MVLASRDLNGVGYEDLIGINIASSGVSTLLSNGNGSFKAVTTYIAKGSVYGVAIGDFTGDAVTDIMSASYTTGSSTLSIGSGTAVMSIDEFSLNSAAEARQALTLIGSSLGFCFAETF